MGPFLLRKSADDWLKERKDTEGAKVAYADNRIDKQTTWSTEGALLYPMRLWQRNVAPNSTEFFGSQSIQFIPSASWKVVNIAETNKGDIEELMFQLPVVWSVTHRGAGWWRNSHVGLTPYYHTDFHFDGEVFGGKLTWTPVFRQEVENDYRGPLLSVNTGYRDLWRSAPLRYYIGLVPALDFNHFSRTNLFITREKHDDYFRAGGKAELGLKTAGYPSLELLASYEAFAGLHGAPDFSDLISLKSKFWFSDYAGVFLQYDKGDTPVAQKKIDLVTFGLELRF